MTLLNTINVGGTDYGITGAAIIGSCPTPAGSEVKACTFSDTFELKAGDMLLVKFTYANTYGDGSTTYPKLQVNGTNYVMRRADGNYLQSGEWGNNATLTFLFDGTDFILPAGSGSERGSGVPLGTILAIHSNQVPDGYLPCNGVQFDTAQFAALYALLGDDHTPDLREVTLRGIGHNGTYVFDSTETDPSTGQAGTQNHDEYTLGEFKDDQIQEHEHLLSVEGYKFPKAQNCTVGNGPRGFTIASQGDSATFFISDSYRKGTVTRGKSVGVNYIIKATSGLPDDQQDYILNTLAPVDEVTVDNMHSVTSNAVSKAMSYSAEEQFTGKYWIDGKPIYRKCYSGQVTETTQTISHGLGSTVRDVIDIKAVIKTQGLFMPSGYYYDNTHNVSIYVNAGNFVLVNTYTGGEYKIVFEYTKTTD